MKLEELEKLQNDIEVLMKKYVDNDGNIKHWKVQSVARSIVKNLIIQRVSQQSELLKEIFDLTAGAWDDPVISEDLYNRMEAAISFNCG